MVSAPSGWLNESQGKGPVDTGVPVPAGLSAAAPV
jgi:hypothetical protein